LATWLARLLSVARSSVMANFETINYVPMHAVVEKGSVRWEIRKNGRRIPGLPQIFWSDGEPWDEANHWALTKASGTEGGHIKTVTSLMTHLVSYANWLETMELNWRHFPIRKQDRTVVLYRGELIAQRDRYSLSPSTVTARMAAVIQFYRHCHAHGFVQRESPMWKDRLVTIRFFDTVGLERAFQRLSSDLSIPNRRRPGHRLEDGLMPLRIDDAMRLLHFAKEQGLVELNLMLSIGMCTGARIETITTLSVEDIERAYPDVQSPDTYKLRVGPGTGVKTKGGVSGELMVPRFLIDELKDYATSMQRYARVDIADKTVRGRLFLTIRGNVYESASFNRLMTDLRRRAIHAGLRFMASFRFHQTRATFGTWLMEVALRMLPVKAAVAFVRDAMLHKDEKTTFLYVRFNQEEPIKVNMSNEFSAAFSGIVNRDWSQYRA
jgi:integrase